MTKETLGKLGLLAMIVLVVVVLMKQNARRNEIQEHGANSICKLTLCEPRGKSSVAFVKYYVDGKKYRTSVGGCPDGGQDKLNKYFEMKYKKDDPNQIVVDFDSEITDTVQINELEKNIKFSMYD